MQAVGRDRHQDHLDEVHRSSAVAVGEIAQRQARNRARQDRRRDQQAELGFTQPEFTLDLDADDGKHGPHGEVHREGLPRWVSPISKAVETLSSLNCFFALLRYSCAISCNCAVTFKSTPIFS